MTNRAPETPGQNENPAIEARRKYTVVRIFELIDKGIDDLAERVGNGIYEGGRKFVDELFKKKS